MNINTKEILTVFASAARTATASSADQFASVHRGVIFTLNISAASGTTPTLDVKIQMKDNVSGVYIDIPGAAFAQKTTTGTDSLVLYPGVTVTANRSVSTVLPSCFKAVATITGTSPSFTFTLAADLIN